MPTVTLDQLTAASALVRTMRHVDEIDFGRAPSGHPTLTVTFTGGGIERYVWDGERTPIWRLT